jgi:hypothetical protein
MVDTGGDLSYNCDSMETKRSILIVLLLCFVACLAADAYAAKRQVSEYEIKAIYIYKFLQFIDWPEASERGSEEEKGSNRDAFITIGIINEKMYESTNKVIKGKTINKDGAEPKTLAIQKLTVKEISETEKLKHFQVLFISSEERDNYKEILNGLKGSCVLTVGDMEGFLEAGGMINLLTEEKKIRFEINNAAAESAGIKIRSKLLRLAKRVVSKTADT